MPDDQQYYSLRHRQTGKLVRYEKISNEKRPFSIVTQHTLTQVGGKVWKAKFPEHALWVLHNSTRWYAAERVTPTHELRVEDWEVVKVTVVHPMEKKIKRVEAMVVALPDPVPYFDFRIKSDPGYELIKRQYVKEKVPITYYRLKEVLQWKTTLAYKLMVLQRVLLED